MRFTVLFSLLSCLGIAGAQSSSTLQFVEFRGIQMAFLRGEFIRKNYGIFLGDVYRPSQIRVWTGEDNRTVTSAEALLASAYKPDKARKWLNTLDWQPVAITLNDTRLPFPKWAESIRTSIPLFRNEFHRRMIDAQNDTVGKYHAELLLSYIEDHINRPINQKNKAVFISGHDSNFMALGRYFNITSIAYKLVPYSALLAVELHSRNGTLYVETVPYSREL
ncbi:unnamed protein product [Strongylus vulgaris]|uniref:Histidine phosphatase family protein n=1 Tax=Strongylus vulgaris TaxID=40348 RepID=A0A3P7KWS0_STRVU|nr:unnamed protein product [Strongylus vulgaris]